MATITNARTPNQRADPPHFMAAFIVRLCSWGNRQMRTNSPPPHPPSVDYITPHTHAHVHTGRGKGEIVKADLFTGGVWGWEGGRRTSLCRPSAHRCFGDSSWIPILRIAGRGNDVSQLGYLNLPRLTRSPRRFPSVCCRIIAMVGTVPYRECANG